MKVLKFGGTSVGSADMIKKVAEIIIKANKKEKVYVVVSAMSGVTDFLNDLCNDSEGGDTQKIKEGIKQLKKIHKKAAKDICKDTKVDIFIHKLDGQFLELEGILEGVTLLREMTHKTRAKILYFGEIFSSLLVSLAVSELGGSGESYLSRELLFCSGKFLDGDCDIKKTKDNIKNFKDNVNSRGIIPIITGFGGGDENKHVYLFDRGGSDYVSTLLGQTLKANSIEIRTDVSGIMSADPRIVDNPIIWKELDYLVAAEFALVGAKVLHPKTMGPAGESGIPIYVKNTFKPEDHGTKIFNTKGSGIKGISIDDKQVMFTFTDPTMIGGPGYVYRITKIFKEAKISIDTIATTETSFTVSIKKRYYSDDLLKEFDSLYEYFGIHVRKNVSKISLVSDEINDYKILSELDDVLMVSSGAHKKSLTIFVKKGDSKKLLRKLHKTIFKT